MDTVIYNSSVIFTWCCEKDGWNVRQIEVRKAVFIFLTVCCVIRLYNNHFIKEMGRTQLVQLRCLQIHYGCSCSGQLVCCSRSFLHWFFSLTTLFKSLKYFHCPPQWFSAIFFFFVPFLTSVQSVNLSHLFLFWWRDNLSEVSQKSTLTLLCQNIWRLPNNTGRTQNHMSGCKLRP